MRGKRTHQRQLGRGQGPPEAGTRPKSREPGTSLQRCAPRLWGDASTGEILELFSSMRAPLHLHQRRQGAKLTGETPFSGQGTGAVSVNFSHKWLQAPKSICMGLSSRVGLDRFFSQRDFFPDLTTDGDRSARSCWSCNQ